MENLHFQTAVYLKRFESCRGTKNADDFINLCNISLKNRLYVSGWYLSELLVEARSAAKDNCLESVISVAYDMDSEKPISVVLITDLCISNGFASPMLYRADVSSFTKKCFRKRGIGRSNVSSAINALANAFEISAQIILSGGEGIDGSEQFWEKSIPRLVNARGVK
jgi:hypothetical protein